MICTKCKQDTMELVVWSIFTEYYCFNCSNKTVVKPQPKPKA